MYLIVLFMLAIVVSQTKIWRWGSEDRHNDSRKKTKDVGLHTHRIESLSVISVSIFLMMLMALLPYPVLGVSDDALELILRILTYSSQ